MSNETKILIALVITVLLTFFITKECSTKYEVVGTNSDTTKTTTTKITTSLNSFSAEQIGKIKRRLIDSLSLAYRQAGAVYMKKIKEQEKDQEHEQDQEKDSAYDKFVYTSEIDTNFVAKDSAGNVTDSMHVKSTFISPTPLPENSIHLVSMDHKSFTKEKETTTTITNSKIVEKKRSFFDRFRIIPNVSAGYGITSRMFDVYAGVGITFEF